MNRGRAEQIARPTEIYQSPATAFVANFLGKINVLPATVTAGVVGIGTGRWAVPGTADGTVNASVRPERLGFSDGTGLAGTVKAKIFQGHHWLFQVATEVGLVLVIAPNDSRAMPSEGTTVRLTGAPKTWCSRGRSARHEGPAEIANGGRTPWLLAGPALLLFAGIVLVPIIMTVLLSFHDWGQYKGIETIITLKNWREVVTDTYFLEIFLRTFRIALLVTVISILIGAPEAYVLNRMNSPWRGCSLSSCSAHYSFRSSHVHSAGRSCSGRPG